LEGITDEGVIRIARKTGVLENISRLWSLYSEVWEGLLYQYRSAGALTWAVAKQKTPGKLFPASFFEGVLGHHLQAIIWISQKWILRPSSWWLAYILPAGCCHQ
jgi:hypothetical protein